MTAEELAAAIVAERFKKTPDHPLVAREYERTLLRVQAVLPNRVGDIDRATVMYGGAAYVGSRVKHYGQRWTGCATATVLGFAEEGLRVHVRLDDAAAWPGTVWDWDRTELAPDIYLEDM